jgi:hypothetical protein
MILIDRSGTTFKQLAAIRAFIFSVQMMRPDRET